jgi:hypothetical protein
MGSWNPADFPNLTNANHKVTSPFMRRYNCIAWAASNDTRNWWPDLFNQGYWPPNVPREETIDAFVQAYETLGYKLCYDERPELGIEKIAIYGVDNPDPKQPIIPTHAARQLLSGEWTSKLGQHEDISHTTPDGVNGPIYGRVVCYMARPIPG